MVLEYRPVVCSCWLVVPHLSFLQPCPLSCAFQTVACGGRHGWASSLCLMDLIQHFRFLPLSQLLKMSTACQKKLPPAWKESTWWLCPRCSGSQGTPGHWFALPRGSTKTWQLCWWMPSADQRRPAHTRNKAGWGRKATELECMVVFRERHAPRAGEAVGPFHWHIALKASSCFRFAPFKRSLAVNHGLASHWSSTHTGLWSAIRYGYIPSPDKPQEVLDSEPFCWHVSGEPMDLFALSQEPLTAAALARSREAKVKQARSSGKAEPRATELDLYPIIVRHGFRNGPDDCNAAEKLVSYLKAHGSPALQAFAFKNRVKLSSLIDDVWSWETVDDFLALHAQSRLDTLKAAAGTACVCHGQWMQTAMHSLMLNGIDPAAFCQDIYCLLANGRREDVPVLVLMGRFGGEGKSFWLSPLRSVYGVEHVQATPQPGNFPLLGLERKKVVLLDDWSFDAEVLPLPTQLLWYEGKPFPLSRPQNSANYTGHILYQGSAPIFVTCKEKDLGPLQEKAHIAFLRGHPSEHTMLLRRLKVHSFHRPLPVRQSGNRIPECQRCFGQLVLQYGQT